MHCGAFTVFETPGISVMEDGKRTNTFFCSKCFTSYLEEEEVDTYDVSSLCENMVEEAREIEGAGAREENNYRQGDG
jgi:hypothetical protein